MNKIYDNGESLLGSIYNVKEYICRNAEDISEIEDLINYLEDFDEDTIVAINYDNGMVYHIDYWIKNNIVGGAINE